MQERFDVVSRLPPEVAVGVLAALDSLEDVMKGAALVCRAWFALATHPALARLWYRRLLRPEPRLPDLSWTENLCTELRACRELGLKRERERIAYSHPTMDRFVWAASRGHIRMIEQLWHKNRESRGRAEGEGRPTRCTSSTCWGTRWWTPATAW